MRASSDPVCEVTLSIDTPAEGPVSALRSLYLFLVRRGHRTRRIFTPYVSNSLLMPLPQAAPAVINMVMLSGPLELPHR
jgi:hypothetical protein